MDKYYPIKKAYNERTYKRYAIRLRKEEDKKLLNEIEKAKEQGIEVTDFFREKYKEYKND